MFAADIWITIIIIALPFVGFAFGMLYGYQTRQPVITEMRKELETLKMKFELKNLPER